MFYFSIYFKHIYIVDKGFGSPVSAGLVYI